jgi:hypothetical protein
MFLYSSSGLRSSIKQILSKKPLYQLDITSWFLLWVCLQAGGYAIIYGKRLMWFESDTIIMCLFIFLISGGLFMLKQRNSKRPLFHLKFSVQKCHCRNDSFFIFYLIRSINNVYSIMATVWKWPWDYIVKIQYWNVAGTLLGVFLSGICLVKGISSRIVFFTGFLLLAIDCAWFTYTFYPDTTLQYVRLISAGRAQGLFLLRLFSFNFRNA